MNRGIAIGALLLVASHAFASGSEEDSCITHVWPAQDPLEQASRIAASGGQDVRTIVTILVDFTDATVQQDTFNGADPVAEIEDLLFAPFYSVRAFYEETTHGKVTFDGDVDDDGQLDYYQVTLDRTASEGCPWSLSSQIDDLVEAQGIDWSLYLHRMYVFPVAGNCTGGGQADLGCGNFCRSFMRSSGLGIYTHELGHNLGLHHSGDDLDNDGIIEAEYGDSSTTMGANTNPKHVVAAHKVLKGWLEPGEWLPVTGGTATYTLTALEVDPAQATFPRALRIFRPSDPNRHYYLSYRADIGLFGANLPSSHLDRLQLHWLGGPYTAYIGSLWDGQTFSDPLADDLVIEQLSHDATTVTFRIERTEPDFDNDGAFDSTDCDDTNPNVYPSAVEICDLLDNNCDGEIDEGFVGCDWDGDGWDETVDCNESDPAINPGATEICDHIDNNCDGQTDEGVAPCDIDGDGYDETVDCDDFFAATYPGAPELCDYRDNDCDGTSDEPDSDGDGVGDCIDVCPDDPTKAYPFSWICDCGIPDWVDGDSDGYPDCVDFCPLDATNTAPDSDGDGVNDCLDHCPTDPAKVLVTGWGYRNCPCFEPDVDSDGDFSFDCFDCGPSDNTTYPGAVEVNDGADNQCAGDAGHGLVDELEPTLRFANLSDRDELSWGEQDGATMYEVARAFVATFDAGVVIFSEPGSSMVDTFLPSPGALATYLVRSLAPNPGSWGARTDGTERVVTP